MANVKHIIAEWSETGKTVYCIIRREVDTFLLDDATGNFGAAPADPYLSLSENATIKGLYEVSESRQVWNNGRYTIAVYKQAGGAPAPASDSMIGGGDMFIYGDTELAGSVWDEINSNHLTSATTGKDLFDAYNAALGAYNTVQDPLFGNPAIKTAINALPSAVNIDTQLSGTHGAGAWTKYSGSGNVAVSDAYPTVDFLRVLDAVTALPLAGVRIIAYLTADYNAGNLGQAYIQGESLTKNDGRWMVPIYLLSANTYTLVFVDNGYVTNTVTLVIP